MSLDKLIHKYEIKVIELGATGFMLDKQCQRQLIMVVEDLKQLKLEQLEDIEIFKRETLTNHYNIPFNTQPKQEPIFTEDELNNIFENILNELSDMEGRILKSINKEKLRRISQK